MSSTCIFYVLDERKHDAFVSARQNEKTVTRKRTLYRTVDVVTGDKFLWEYLDAAARIRSEFSHSGFAMIDYVFAFLNLPDALSKAVDEGRINDHCFAFTAPLAQRLGRFLASNVPDLGALTDYAVEKGEDSPRIWAAAMSAAHDTLQSWCLSVQEDNFGVLCLTF